MLEKIINKVNRLLEENVPVSETSSYFEQYNIGNISVSNSSEDGTQFNVLGTKFVSENPKAKELFEKLQKLCKEQCLKEVENYLES